MELVNQRDAVIARLAASNEEVAALQAHVREIREGHAFRGSDRCGRFLTYIIDQAIAGRMHALKERVIGVEVFGRSPDYDTSEDAIVRVTASDVRKRLLQHYGRNGVMSEFRIWLPVGSYVPEITHDTESGTVQSPTRSGNLPLQMMSLTVNTADRELQPIPIPGQEGVDTPPRSTAQETALPNRHFKPGWLAFAIGVIALNLTAWVSAWRYGWQSRVRPDSAFENAPVSVLPWSALLSSPRTTHLITSDPDIGKIQRLAGGRISVSD
jgi:hypothetical protein